MGLLILIAAAAAILYFYLKNSGSAASSLPTYRNDRVKPRKNYGKPSSTNKYDTSLVENNRLEIEKAIRDGKKVSFRYKDKEERITERTVTPQRTFWYEFDEGGGQMLCVEAFCHLRNSSRTFALFRMSQVRLN